MTSSLRRSHAQSIATTAAVVAFTLQGCTIAPTARVTSSPVGGSANQQTAIPDGPMGMDKPRAFPGSVTGIGRICEENGTDINGSVEEFTMTCRPHAYASKETLLALAKHYGSDELKGQVAIVMDKALGVPVYDMRNSELKPRMGVAVRNDYVQQIQCKVWGPVIPTDHKVENKQIPFMSFNDITAQSMAGGAQNYIFSPLPVRGWVINNARLSNSPRSETLLQISAECKPFNQVTPTYVVR